ncbi:MAG: Unknown protein [uncultured Sulfurovum sp.]|uniref:DUF4178 domain-containing protein n=1 Tax=uncultured Sulfurovum sp. TaxID=269237 RepID=A0A6S6TXW9_9BACT|nr:MAG: Unknown protein [uncultured Sulfurovum sp.]
MLFKTEIDKSKNCPQCGDALELHFKYSKLVKCLSCGSSIFLEDDSVKLIGESSVLSAEPSLIKLHKPFKYKNKNYLPLGKIRYGYGRGFWEEWFLKDESNKEFWLSIDEGDFVLQEKVKRAIPFKHDINFTVGSKHGQYLVTEKGQGHCVGFEGELPFEIRINEVHQYVHLSQGGGNLLTLEFTKTLTETFKGKWIDPLDIEVLYA